MTKGVLFATFAQMSIDPAGFVQYGIVGIVLAWFMFRMERKLDRHTSVINDLVETMALEVMARETLGEHVRSRVSKILDRAEERARSMPPSRESSVQ